MTRHDAMTRDEAAALLEALKREMRDAPVPPIDYEALARRYAACSARRDK